MKIRLGFVSNSSSSSFCIYGISMDKSEFIKKCKDIFKIETKEDEDEEQENIHDFMDKVSDFGLSVRSPCDYDEVYIGDNWYSIKDEQTGAQFKKDIEEKIEKFLGDKPKCKTISEAWRS